jgi:hypothetical protein
MTQWRAQVHALTSMNKAAAAIVATHTSGSIIGDVRAACARAASVSDSGGLSRGRRARWQVGLVGMEQWYATMRVAEASRCSAPCLRPDPAPPTHTVAA